MDPAKAAALSGLMIEEQAGMGSHTPRLRGPGAPACRRGRTRNEGGYVGTSRFGRVGDI